MSRLLTTIAKTHAALNTTHTRASARVRQARNERGSVSLEQVIVAVGLAGLAAIIITAIGVAVARYTGRL